MNSYNSTVTENDQLGLDIDLNPGPPTPNAARRGSIKRTDGEAAVKDLFNSAFKLKGKTFLTGLLKFITKTRQYSTFNLGLIYAQRPGAAAVGTESYWKKHRRRVKPDAIPIVILRPQGPVCFVYEISDTEGRSLLGDEVMDPFRVRGTITDESWHRFLTGVAREKVFSVAETNYGWNLAGQVRALHATATSRTIQMTESKFGIRIASRLSASQKAVTLAHELAHVYCGHLGQTPKCWWPDRPSLSHNAEEFEAETATWIVATRSGLETPSAEYLIGHANDSIWSEIDVDAIVKAANRIEAIGFPVAQS